MAVMHQLCLLIGLFCFGRHLGIASASCPDADWVPDGDFCYLFKPDEKVNWGRARYDCIRAGTFKADIVSIATKEENDFVVTLMADFSMNPDPENYWLGIIRDGRGAPYRWGDGTPLTYTNWAAGEPGDNSHDCVESIFYEGTWADVDCLERKGYVCKIAKKPSA